MNKLLFSSTLLLFSVATLVAAQSYLGYLYPASAQRGTTVRVIAGGQGIGGNPRLLLSNEAIQLKSATFVPSFGNIKRPQSQWLQTWLKNIDNGNPTRPPLDRKQPNFEEKEWHQHPWFETVDTLPPLERSILADMVFVRKNPLQATPSLSQRLILEFEIPADAPLGPCMLRILNNKGITNEKLFFIEAEPQVNEPLYAPPSFKQTPWPVVTTLPVTLNGQILPGECDRVPFQLTQGTTYTFAMCAAYLSPFLGDTVPGHFQGTLSVVDPEGHEVAFADDEYHHADPVLHFTPTQTGIYTLQITDALKRGRADFVYRIQAFEGEGTYHPYPIWSDYQPQQHIFTRAALPTTWTSQALQAGIEIQGALLTETPDKLLTFDAQQGDELVFEVYARRLDSPLDSVLTLRNEQGEVVAENDDGTCLLNIDRCCQNVDSLLAIKIPETGRYTITLSDRMGAYGKDFSYRLQVRRPTPSVSIFTQSSVLMFDKKDNVTLKFFALRKDGFNDAIQLSCKGLKALGEAIIPADKNTAEITFSHATPPPHANPETFVFTASYTTQGHPVQTTVVPADESMQAFAYTHLLTAKTCYGFTTGQQKPWQKRKQGKAGKQGTPSPKQP